VQKAFVIDVLLVGETGGRGMGLRVPLLEFELSY
jgi:hypothetical protein